VSIGPFHRRETPTQTKEDAVLQTQSGEIWGKTPRGGNLPTVQAYAGNLPGGRGIEFHTEIEPNPSGSPYEARWYLGLTPGVVQRERDGVDYACISACVDNKQP